MGNIFKVRGKIKLLPLIIISISPLLCGLSVLYLNRNAFLVYNMLDKPIFTFPPVVFISIWFVMYLLMGIAAYRIYMIRDQGTDIGNSVFFFLIQLLLSYLWFFIFFSYRLYGLAFIENKIMLIFSIITFTKFLRLDRIAAVLLIPHILWIIYVGVINFFIWMYNEM